MKKLILSAAIVLGSFSAYATNDHLNVIETALASEKCIKIKL